MRIFLSYRADDSRYVTDRIYAWLRRAFGPGEVWRAADVMRISADFAGTGLARFGSDVRRGDTALHRGTREWRLHFGGRDLMCQCQDNVDRMRLVVPICPLEGLEDLGKHVVSMLQANCHTALDPRYGIQNGEIVSAFLHPMRSLRRGQFYSALQHVTEMAWTFGSSYSSSEIFYGAPVSRAE